jgi:hypothetical protein
MFGELVREYFGLSVIDYNSETDWKGPGKTYRLREEYDDEIKFGDRLQSLLTHSDVDKLTALIIGTWTGACEGTDSSMVVQSIASAASRLQSNASPLLAAFPKLESIRIRGGSGLSFSRIEHHSLRELSIETGGLSSSTIREVFQCNFPELAHLELQLGDDSYGFDGSVEDLQPLLAGKLFPKLQFLGLMNSVIANDIAAVLVNSPIASRVEEIDLSLGNLDAEGLESLKGLAEYRNLRSLNISHHYAPPKKVDELVSALPFNVIAGDPQEPEDEWRPIVHAE